MKKFKNIYHDLIYVSRITGTNKKKLKILLSVVLANINVFLDIGSIVILTALLVGKVSVDNAIVDYVVENKFLLPIIILTRFVFNFIEKMNLRKLELDIQGNLKTYLLKEVFNKSNYTVSDAFYFVNEVTTHVSYFYGSLASLLNAALQIIIYASYLFFTNASTITVFLLGSLFLAFPTRYFLLQGRKYTHIFYELARTINFSIQKILDNLYLIKILRKTDEEIINFDNIVKSYNSALLKNNIFGTINSSIPGFVTVFVLSCLIVFFDFPKRLTIDFIGVILRLFQTLGTLNQSLNRVINSHVHLEKLHEIEKNRLKIRESAYILSSELDDNTAIALEDLKFAYFNSEENLFQNLNLEIKRFQHTIITGPNGTGKSTLLGLLAGVLYPLEGLVKTHTSKFGYIGVTPMIITGTLRENLLYGSTEKIEDSKILESINQFQLFNENIDNVLELEVSNKSLSSGQMQKVSFIRAILSNVEILLLDESTSNLDDYSRDLIFKILKEKKITIINCTHNPEFFDYDNEIKIKVVNNERKLSFN